MWDHATVLHSDVVLHVAKRLVAAKDRYLIVEKKTGVPWWWIAPVHERESSQSWTRSLAQGDPWNQVSVHVPRGRGPFKSWEDAAYDALVTLKHLDRVFGAAPDAVRLEKALYQWERYNGWGYYQYHPNCPSPYLWGSTSIQRPGKYVSDGKWSATTMDVQLGCVAMLKTMMLLDSTIAPQRED
jgi:lysozyme family protein